MHPSLDLSEGRLFIRRGGRRLLPFFYCTPDPEAETVRRFRDAGVCGVSFSATADFHPYGLAAPAWLSEDRYDWSELDRRASAAIAGFPEALLLLRVHLCSPPWWDELHRSELVVWDGDRTEHDFLHGYLKRTCASWSSRPWRRAAARNLAALLAHARAATWGGNVAGVLVAAGNTEEWFQVGTMEGLLPDYSAPAREAFGGWLRAQGWDSASLTSRWGFEISPDRATAPPLERRRTGAYFRDPKAEAWAMDFDAFLADEAASFIGELCAVVHEAADGAWFAGAFFGYLTEMACFGEGVLHGGHLGLGRALRDERIDFLASPGSYARRDLRSGAAQSMLPVRAAVLAGKAVFHENDVRTHVLQDDAGYGWTERPSETASAQAREAGFALAQGAGLWWFDMTGAFYDDAHTLDSIARICRLAATPRPPRAAALVAFVVDEDSLAVTALPPDRYSDAIPRQLLELARLGAAYDVRLVSELPEDHGYRFLVFPNLFRVEPSRLEHLRALTRRASLSLFVGPVGLAPVSDGAPPGPRAVTGLPVEVLRQRTWVEVLLDRAIFEHEAGAPTSFGRRFEHDSVVVPTGPVRVLGRHWHGGGPAFFEASVGETRAAYAADAIVPAAALRLLAREAGVPIALESGDVFATDGTLFSVTASSEGVRRIKIGAARRALAEDASTSIPAPGGVVTAPMSAGQTLTFVAIPDS